MRQRLRRLSLAVAVVMVAITLAGAWAARTAVRDQESRLLAERTNEVGQVLNPAIGALPAPPDVLGGVLRATQNSPAAFARASAAAEVGSSGKLTFALIHKTPAGFAVVMANGGALQPGQVVSDRRSLAFQRALTTAALVPTSVIGSGANRSLGFALGPPVAPTGTLLFRQESLGPVGAPREASTAPFSELDVAIYASARPEKSEVLAETGTLPLHGLVRTQPLPAGAVTWTLQASAVHPLVGAATADAPWIVLAGGTLLALLVGLVVEAETRRRKSATALYESEHRVAKTLQRSLLPTLAELPGLSLAVRYLAGSAKQEVGGDWFDAFGIEDGRVGLVIGDVVGHDIAAAVAMSQMQVLLRACAWNGEPPAAVLDHLDALVANFDISDLVTVFYGILDPADDLGSRRLVFANAGHLPPIVRQPDGQVAELAGAASLLLGAPSLAGTVRAEGEAVLSAGSILLLFTDGLVEAPGEPLMRSLSELSLAVADAPADINAETLCDLVLAKINPDRLRDDVAVLAVQVDQVDQVEQVATPLTRSDAAAPIAAPL